MSTDSEVNPHYLGHVVALSESSEVEASEDILASNGMKLLGKGAKIDSRVKDRLLEHKLKKPLETMMRVVDGVGTRRIDRVAETLLERHPLLLRICSPSIAKRLITSLRAMSLSQQLDSLVSVYAGQGPNKLEHAVGIALLAAALAESVQRADADPAIMLMAGLVHDVGELYIDPALMQGGAKLTPAQWKHIVAHPIIGARVLKDMPGVNAKTVKAVLGHHERLDGFGYPLGLRGDELSAEAQVLGTSEMLMGLMEGGSHIAMRADVAMKLIPGEFNRALIDRVVTAARDAEPAADETHSVEGAEALLSRMNGLSAALGNFRQMRAQLQTELPRYSPATRSLLEQAMDRGERIHAALLSTGLGHQGADALHPELQATDPRLQAEIGIVLRELKWRLGELNRQVVLRGEQLPAGEAARVRQLMETPTA